MALRAPHADIVPLTLVGNRPFSVPPPFKDARLLVQPAPSHAEGSFRHHTLRRHYPWARPDYIRNAQTIKLGCDMGGVQNVWGEETYTKQCTLQEKLLRPSKRASAVLSLGFLCKKKQRNDT